MEQNELVLLKSTNTCFVRIYQYLVPVDLMTVNIATGKSQCSAEILEQFLGDRLAIEQRIPESVVFSAGQGLYRREFSQCMVWIFVSLVIERLIHKDLELEIGRGRGTWIP